MALTLAKQRKRMRKRNSNQCVPGCYQIVSILKQVCANAPGNHLLYRVAGVVLFSVQISAIVTTAKASLLAFNENISFYHITVFCCMAACTAILLSQLPGNGWLIYQYGYLHGAKCKGLYVVWYTKWSKPV